VFRADKIGTSLSRRVHEIVVLTAAAAGARITKCMRTAPWPNPRDCRSPWFARWPLIDCPV